MPARTKYENSRCLVRKRVHTCAHLYNLCTHVQPAFHAHAALPNNTKPSAIPATMRNARCRRVQLPPLHPPGSILPHSDGSWGVEGRTAARRTTHVAAAAALYLRHDSTNVDDSDDGVSEATSQVSSTDPPPPSPTPGGDRALLVSVPPSPPDTTVPSGVIATSTTAAMRAARRTTHDTVHRMRDAAVARGGFHVVCSVVAALGLHLLHVLGPRGWAPTLLHAPPTNVHQLRAGSTAWWMARTAHLAFLLMVANFQHHPAPPRPDRRRALQCALWMLSTPMVMVGAVVAAHHAAAATHLTAFAVAVALAAWFEARDVRRVLHGVDAPPTCRVALKSAVRLSILGLLILALLLPLLDGSFVFDATRAPPHARALTAGMSLFLWPTHATARFVRAVLMGLLLHSFTHLA